MRTEESPRTVRLPQIFVLEKDDIFKGLSIDKDENEQAQLKYYNCLKKHAEDQIYHAKILFQAFDQSKQFNVQLDNWRDFSGQLDQENDELYNEKSILEDAHKELTSLRVESNALRCRNDKLTSENISLRKERTMLVESLAKVNADNTDIKSMLEKTKDELEKAKVAIEMLESRCSGISLESSRAARKQRLSPTEARDVPSFRAATGRGRTPLTEVFEDQITTKEEPKKPPTGRKVSRTRRHLTNDGSTESVSTTSRYQTNNKVSSQTTRSTSLGTAEKSEKKGPVRATRSATAKASTKKASLRGLNAVTALIEPEVRELGRTPLRDRLRSRSRQTKV